MDGYIYRIYTEDKGNTEEIATIMEGWGFPGFTIIDTNGYWHGVKEDGLIIELVCQASPDPLDDYHKIRACAREIGSRGQQNEVLVTMQEVTRIDFLTINS